MAADSIIPQSPDEVKKWDRVGVVLSAICGLHCLVTPFLTLSLPFWVYSIHYSPFHLAIAIFIIPIGLYAFWNGFKRHQKRGILILGILGLVLLSVALTAPSSRNQLRWNDIMTLVGSVCLIAAHIANRRALKRKPLTDSQLQTN
jgi:hypothetical protein